MRDDLRRTCSEIWVIDCSPEGHQPDVPTRIFQAVQQPVCIVLAARKLGKGADEPAQVRFRALPIGTREDEVRGTQGNVAWRFGMGGLPCRDGAIPFCRRQPDFGLHVPP